MCVCYGVYGICVPVHSVQKQGQRPGEVSFSIILHLTSWRHAQSLNKTLSAFQVDRLVSKPSDHVHTPASALGLEVCVAAPNFNVSTGDSNSGPQDCTASLLIH